MRAINNFRIVYYRGINYRTLSSLVTGSNADVCQHVEDPVSKRISAVYLTAY